MAPLGGQPAHGGLDPRFPDLRQLFEGGPRGHLGTGAAGCQCRPAPISLEARLLDAPIPHAQVEAREIHALLVLAFSHPIGLAHHARIAGVTEVIDQRVAVLH